MKLYPYQTEYANRLSTFDITNKSRQIGFSSGAIAYKAVKRCYFDNINQMLVSSSQRQSNKLMSYIEKWITKFYVKNGVKLVKDSTTVKEFDNGKAIYCLPSNPETIQGFDGDVRIDEFALHKEDKKIFEGLLPTITSNTNFQLSISSKPLGQGNMFYTVYTDLYGYPDFVRTKIDCYDAMRMGCKMNLDIIKRNFDEESFRQEFECEFVDEATSYFTYELLKNCVSDYDTEALKGKTCIGIDIGRSHDLTAVAVFVEVLDTLYLKRLEVLKNTNFVSQKEIISGIIQDEQPLKVLIDKGAIGMQLAEDLERDFLQVEGVQFTVNFKNELVTNCKKVMEQGKFKMYEDRKIINAFHKIKRTVTSSNNINFDSNRDSDGHSDESWACMLACYALRYSVESFGTSESLPELDVSGEFGGFMNFEGDSGFHEKGK